MRENPRPAESNIATTRPVTASTFYLAIIALLIAIAILAS
jgi:hypothetical protein